MQARELASSDDHTQLIQLAQAYVSHLEKQEIADAQQTLQQLNALSGSDASTDGLFTEVGKLTRELHESINRFVQDTRMQVMTNEDMPDARQRLNHVIELSEESAHKTMTSIENSTPLLSTLYERSTELQQQLQENRGNHHQQEGMAYLNEELDAFLLKVASDTRKVSKELNEIMMIQANQDLSGQVIQRVISLVHEVEINLLGLLKAGGEPVAGQATTEKQQQHDNSGYGPVVPGVTTGEVVQSQEEVDDLLSSLGF